MATIAQISKLRQVVQQQAKLMQKQVEDARRRENELIFHQNEMFEAFMQRILVCYEENRVGTVAEQPSPEVRPQPQQPLGEP